VKQFISGAPDGAGTVSLPGRRLLHAAAAAMSAGAPDIGLRGGVIKLGAVTRFLLRVLGRACLR